MCFLRNLDKLSTANSSIAVSLQHCQPDHHGRVARDVSHHASTDISLGPFELMSETTGEALFKLLFNLPKRSITEPSPFLVSG